MSERPDSGAPRLRLLTLAVLLGLVLPFAGKPVHIDDANFLVLARGAAADPWRPHAVDVNWQGTMERAFDVLSNPPGIGWWLAPVAHAPVWAQHLWMLPWLLLAWWGAWVLAERFSGRPAAGTLLLLGAPASVLAAQALTPDLPLLACTLAGMAGLVRGEPRALAARWPWAVLVGCAGLFRYSGLALVAVVLAWPLVQRGRAGLRAAFMLGTAALLPSLLLALHDVLAYGQPHVLAMTGFQGTADTPREVFHKMAAALAMLGGALALPVLCWSRLTPTLVGLVAGCLVGGFAASLSDHSQGAALATLAFCSAGGAVLGGCVPERDAPEAPRRWDRDAVFLLLWVGLGLLFLLKLRFTAARYWLPFFAPAVLLPLRMAKPRPLALAIPLTLLVTALLSVDDLRLAQAQLDLARRVHATAEREGGPGLFAGHWGWQHHLEARGWTPLEDDAPIPPGVLLATSEVAWPQEHAESCLVFLDQATADGPGLLWPRVHSRTGAANLHASMIAGRPPVESYAPWTWSSDPYDTATLWRGCRGAVGEAEVIDLGPVQALSQEE